MQNMFCMAAANIPKTYNSETDSCTQNLMFKSQKQTSNLKRIFSENILHHILVITKTMSFAPFPQNTTSLSLRLRVIAVKSFPQVIP